MKPISQFGVGQYYGKKIKSSKSVKTKFQNCSEMLSATVICKEKSGDS